MNADRLEDLLLKFNEGKLSNAEQAELDDLLSNSDEARADFKAWNFINESIETLLVDDNKPLSTTRAQPRIVRFRRLLTNVAAILTLPLLISTIYLLSNQKSTTIRYNEVSSKNNKMTKIILSDSSIVHLYAGSTLKYPETFDGKEREVSLVGEATFEVKSDLEHPFYVNAIDNSRVKAYGTKFNVCSYDRDDIIVVYLEHGSVDFISSKLENPVVLTPSKELTFQRKTLDVSIVDAPKDKYNAYEKGIILFKNTHLTDVAKRLSRAYNVDIEIEDDSIADYHFSATFENESLTQILNLIEQSTPEMGWRKNKESDKVLLFRK